MVLASEQFGQLVKVMLRARGAPDALAIVLPGNPAVLAPDALTAAAEAALDRAAARLVGEADT